VSVSPFFSFKDFIIDDGVVEFAVLTLDEATKQPKAKIYKPAEINALAEGLMKKDEDTEMKAALFVFLEHLCSIPRAQQTPHFSHLITENPAGRTPLFLMVWRQSAPERFQRQTPPSRSARAWVSPSCCEV